MKKNLKFIVIFLIIFPLFFLITGCPSQENVKKIGVVVPLENASLNEIVAGFTEKLRALSSQPLKIKVANAQGDLNLQRAIIQQMRDEKYDVIVPIGTGATQMSAAIIREQAIVGLAANYFENDKRARKFCNITVVHDEISPEQIVNFIHQVNPQLVRITLLHSATDKIFPDVKVAVDAGKKLNIEIKPLLVQSLSDLYSIANAIPSDTQAILILKDIPIASGISTLKMIANKRQIPLITSDEGTVEEGALFAVGVREREIGERGAELAAKILQGQSACELEMVDMKKLTVFVNKKNLENEKKLASSIAVVAKKLNYKITIS